VELELGPWWVGDATSATVDGDTLAGGAPSSCVADLHSATATPPESRTRGAGGRGLATLRAAVAWTLGAAGTKEPGSGEYPSGIQLWPGRLGAWRPGRTGSCRRVAGSGSYVEC